MEKIVKSPVKVDFHIHSYASNHKDKSKVSSGKLENLETLIQKLIKNELNMVAITDHDNFDCKIYLELKKQEQLDNCIKKVLPGVEFSVLLDSKVIHVIALFDDCDNEKILKIQEKIYNTEINKPYYDHDNCFSESKFLEILKNIGLSTILIAHQKNSLSSLTTRKNDINTIGMEKLEELVFVDYFEAFEFKERKNEIFNKNYIENQRKKLQNMKFITGSDCHIWENYPEKDKTSFEFSYLKCLPTFKGVMMAVTGEGRIKIGNDSFFSVVAPIPKIELTIDGKHEIIELSKGINAIIGDNSIGKSLLLHKLTNYEYLNSPSVKKGYESYLKKHNIEILTRIKKDNIRSFDGQGNIREMFINKKTSSKDFINQYYPPRPNYINEKNLVQEKVNEFIKYLKNKKEYNDKYNKLNDIIFRLFEDEASSLTISKININTNDCQLNLTNLVDLLKQTISQNEKLIKEKLLTEEEMTTIKRFTNYLKKLQAKYNNELEKERLEQKKIDLINTIIDAFNNELQHCKTEEQKTRELYNEQFSILENTIIELLKIDKKNIDLSIPNIKLEPNDREVGEYRFVCKAVIDEINAEYIYQLLTFPLASDYKKKIKEIIDINPDKFLENIKIGDENPEDIYAYYGDKINKKLADDFTISQIINNAKRDNITDSLSSGANVQIYFDLLSHDRNNQGIYIIDQPEDDVSQSAIKRKLLKNFQNIGENRQVLLITHNPQFIINLDVDNVIFLSKEEESDKVNIQYGALEYVNSNTNILKIVADNIEGGIDSIKERYKKYEKNN